MSKHVCELNTGTCYCNAFMSEPCGPCLGEIPWPPRCIHCGRFMPWHLEMSSPEEKRMTASLENRADGSDPPSPDSPSGQPSEHTT